MSSKTKKKKSANKGSDGRAISSTYSGSSSSSKTTSSKASSSYVSSKSKPEKKRTTLMWVAIVVIVVHGLAAAIAYSSLKTDPSVNHPALISMAVLHFLANVVAAYGIYKWKKWGLQVYAYSAILGVVTGAMAMGLWSIFVLILPLVILGYIFKAHYDQFE
jgi:hypothetical protein